MNKDQNTPEQEMSEDNLLNELDSFNNGSLQEVDKEESNADSAELQEEAPEQAQDIQEKTESKQSESEEVAEIEQWLIENKFKDDEDGRSKLAEAYKQLQSKTDKERNEFSQKEKKYSKLAQLDEFLSNNPDVVQKLTQEVQVKKEESNLPPKKPEDYDILDESIENSSSAQWRQQYDQWLIRQGSAQAIGEIEKLKSELSESQAFEMETVELQKMGLSDTDIVEYRQFMADPNNVTQENLVNIWKMIAKNGKSSNSIQKEKEPQPKNKQNSPASVSGSVPNAVEPEKKELDAFWDGIMEFNNNNS
tara:strand:+ start:872 stop:1789 length:918 start_codon:yes stop_codon:yes gene_type:complete